jgi:hypothetical protein
VDFHTLAPDYYNPDSRQDLDWSADGSLVWSPATTVPKIFYDLNGVPRPPPPHEADDEFAALSPDHRYLASSGARVGGATVRNLATGLPVVIPPLERILAWADIDHIIAQSCRPHCEGRGEYHHRFVLARVGSRRTTPLTGYQDSLKRGWWEPTFTHR